MKKNCWLLIFTALFLTGLQAQDTNTTAPIVTPGASPALTNAADTASSATNAAAAAPSKKKTARKKTARAAAAQKKIDADLKTTPLVAGPATVIASNVNVRGQAGLKGEVIGRLN